MRRIPLLFAAATLVVATTVAGATHKPAAPRSQMPLKEFMGHVFQRNAEQFWAWSAEEVDASGVHSARPKNESEWEAAESDAHTLRELTFTLETSTYRIDDPAWRAGLKRVRVAADRGAAAAEAKDYAALGEAANAVNAACVACHLHYAPELEGPPPGAVGGT